MKNIIQALEEVSLNAWPCLQQVLYDGWVLRFANGYTRRSNSVNPIYEGSRDLRQKLRFCEEMYQDKGLPPIFKLTAASYPETLDSLLTEAGYVESARTSIQTLDLGSYDTEPDEYARAVQEPEGPWLDAFSRFNNIAPRYVPTLEAILNRIAPRRRLISILEDGEICACGMGVLQDQWMGLFDIVTRPDCRKRGFGQRVLGDLLHWGKTHEAKTAYLQVMLDNTPALRLYARLGFREGYQYWYRVKDVH